jgi:exopolysaccharide biosynthesis protein
MNIRLLFKIILMNLFITSMALASDGYEYSLHSTPDQTIHLVKIDLKKYDMSLVSAHNSVFGREKVGDIAKRENASIAINGGFFQIGGNEDGRPTGTLIINGELFGLRTSKHAVFSIRDKVPSVEIWQPNIELGSMPSSHPFKITPKKFNKFANNTDIILYSSKWAPSTLTPYNTRKEAIISNEMVVTDIADHGNNNIPAGGYVLSLPTDHDISSISVGDHITFNNDEYTIFDKKTSALMGIPYLIMNGQINNELSETQKHARTAIGIDKDGKIIIAIVECVYAKNINSLTFQEIKEIMQENKISLADKSAADIKNLLSSHLSSSSAAQGLTMKELAEFMQKAGCVDAINLDGGGSSSLYINGKYVNNAVGDKDEAEGLAQVRPVSDAIVFKEISKRPPEERR